MKDRYFTAEVKPLIPASRQHAASFTAGDVLFDWTEVQIPKGTSRCIGAAALVRPKGNATPTANPFGFFIVFSKTNTQTLGTVNGTPDKVPTNDLLGLLEIEDTTSYVHANLKSTNIGMAGRASNTSTQANLLITPSQQGDNVGFDKFYIGGIANGEFDFTSINAIAESGAAEAASTQVITMDGTSMDVRHHFIDGDVVHIGTSVGTPAADSLIGTVASADSATQITLDAVSPTELVDGDILYNINPIRIILFFEK
tara:strand:- start:50 stop:817 length:768 start_codon:yes stop_codon:yes gene_type:complete